MNRTCLPEAQYRMNLNAYASSAAPVSEEKNGGLFETILSFFDLMITLILSPAVRTTLRVLGVFACFVAVLFVIGAVEAETLGFGAGALLSFLFSSVAFLCVYRPKKSA